MEIISTDLHAGRSNDFEMTEQIFNRSDKKIRARSEGFLCRSGYGSTLGEEGFFRSRRRAVSEHGRAAFARACELLGAGNAWKNLLSLVFEPVARHRNPLAGRNCLTNPVFLSLTYLTAGRTPPSYTPCEASYSPHTQRAPLHPGRPDPDKPCPSSGARPPHGSDADAPRRPPRRPA